MDSGFVDVIHMKSFHDVLYMEDKIVFNAVLNMTKLECSDAPYENKCLEIGMSIAQQIEDFLKSRTKLIGSSESVEVIRT